MTILIGLAPHERGEAAAHLGAIMARSLKTDLVVAAITPEPWPQVPYREDKEYLKLQRKAAKAALAQAKGVVGRDITAEYIVEKGRSVASGLIEVAKRYSADVVVLGSSARGLAGLVSLGGVAERVLHTLDIPVCFAPDGYRTALGSRVRRLTVAFGRGDRDSGLLTRAAEQALHAGADLRVACFAVRPFATGSSIEDDAEDLVLTKWAKVLRKDIEPALEKADADPASTPIVIGEGGSWHEALAAVDWYPNEVLVVGGSSSPVASFFLGSHASKIVRNAPVPVLILRR